MFSFRSCHFCWELSCEGCFPEGPHGPESNGIVAVAGGASDLVVTVLIVAPIVFLFAFMLLQKRSRRD